MEQSPNESTRENEANKPARKLVYGQMFETLLGVVVIYTPELEAELKWAAEQAKQQSTTSQ